MATSDLLFQSLIEKSIDSELGISRDESKEKRDTSLADALMVTREQEQHALDLMQQQEIHQADLFKAGQESRSINLKNEKQELDIQVAMRKAAKEGNYVDPQEPTPQEPQEPANSAAAMQAMLENQRRNPKQELLKAMEFHYKRAQATGEKDAGLEGELTKFVYTQVLDSLKRIDDTSLDYSPLGGLGKGIGTVLDVLLPGTPGTDLLGGKIGAIPKLKVLMGVSPLIRSEISDLFNRDKLEQTSAMRLGKMGLGSMAPHLQSDFDKAGEEIIKERAVLIDLTMQDEAADVFGPNASNNIREAFYGFQSIHALLSDMRQASTPEEVVEIANNINDIEIGMREAMDDYIAKGGTVETFNQEMIKAHNAIRDEHITQVGQLMNPTEAVMRSQRLQINTADTYMKQLTDFRAKMVDDHEMNIEEVQKTLPPKVAEEFGRVKRLESVGVDLKNKHVTSLLREAKGAANSKEMVKLLQKIIPLDRPGSPARTELQVEALRQAGLTGDPEKMQAVNRAFDEYAADLKGKYMLKVGPVLIKSPKGIMDSVLKDVRKFTSGNVFTGNDK